MENFIASASAAEMSSARSCCRVSVAQLHKLSSTLLLLLGLGPRSEPASVRTMELEPASKTSGGTSRCFYSLYSFIIHFVELVSIIFCLFTTWKMKFVNKHVVFGQIWVTTTFMQMIFFSITFIRHNAKAWKISVTLFQWVEKFLKNITVSSSKICIWIFYSVLLVFIVVLIPFLMISEQTIRNDPPLPAYHHFMHVYVYAYCGLMGSVFFLHMIVFESVCTGMMNICLELFDKIKTLRSINTSNLASTPICTRKIDAQPYNPVQSSLKTNASSYDSLRLQLTQAAHIISSVYQLTDGFMSVFGFAILMWIVNSVPNYTLCVYFQLLGVMLGAAFNFFKVIYQTILLVSQLIIMVYVFNVGETLEQLVSKNLHKFL